MSRNWTEEQKQVISLRDRNILVSAAAGSGKTAVLVERIIQKLTDPVRPVDIDRLLIMTFTRAAAGEMKERISAAIEKALYDNPDNENLQRQSSLIHTAQINTIDGFCAYLIRNYFHLIDLDPGYRVGDEGELKLLREDVLKEVLEQYYQQASPDFLNLVECYGGDKTDDAVKELILKVYDHSMSSPDPESWLRECLDFYRADTVDKLRETGTMRMIFESAEEELGEAERIIRTAIEICHLPGGPYLYEEALDDDLLLIREAREKLYSKEYDKLRHLLGAPAFTRLSTKRPKDVEPELKDRVKELREGVKTTLKDLGVRLFSCTEEEILQMSLACLRQMETLCQVVRSFRQAFADKKREKNILDFTDMEHFALQILMKKQEDGSYEMTQAARELSEKYDEVMVDEYQDSNLIQEYLTNSVSGWINERKNVFMVGDVKQSIYRFRLARPELFMEKYHSYQTEDSLEQRIDLHKNFRSRAEVLSSVNYIFRQIMGADLGGIDYDDAAALYPGAVFPEGGDKAFPVTEVLLVEKDGEELEDQPGDNARELEALAIAQRIRDMVGRDQIVDSATGTYRPVEFGDIVVLLRTASGWAETFSQIFESVGIPAYTSAKTGYFSALEIVTVLNYLRICDNPRQDIALASVLKSPIVGCSAEELAVIRADYKKMSYYESICAYLADGQFSFYEEENTIQLKRKLQHFLDQLQTIREHAEYTPIHELILEVLHVTGYGSYARALPGGEQRNANLTMLVERALDYEKTSYRGLFNFIRYIEKLQKYEVDFGEVNLADAGSKAVQIMTIHKSKGLEFPVVFVAGMGKQFNFQDANARLLVHPELGLGADVILADERKIVTTVHKQMVRRQIISENLGEELRVLYVALTRAKEKLILAGSMAKLDKEIESLAGFMELNQELLPIAARRKAKNYWSYVLPALARHRAMDDLYHSFGFAVHAQPGLHDAEAEFQVRIVTAADLTAKEVGSQVNRQILEQRLKEWDPDVIYDREIRENLNEKFSYVYPFSYLREIPVKVSVSELKKKSYSPDPDEAQELFPGEEVLSGERFSTEGLEQNGLQNGALQNGALQNGALQIESVQIEPLIPTFLSEEKEVFTGSARGTAYHRVMECLDYHLTDHIEDIETQIQTMLTQQKLMQAEADCVVREDIMDFLASGIGSRMKAAALKGKLFREQPFVISETARLLNPEWDYDESVLVQGIIDAFFWEDGEIVLVDYKTDKVRRGGEQKLIDLYHRQLEDYARALERTLGCKVKEAYIYSFTLGKEIRLF